MIELTLPTMTCGHCVKTVTAVVQQVDAQARLHLQHDLEALLARPPGEELDDLPRDRLDLHRRELEAPVARLELLAVELFVGPRVVFHVHSPSDCTPVTGRSDAWLHAGRADFKRPDNAPRLSVRTPCGPREPP